MNLMGDTKRFMEQFLDCNTIHTLFEGVIKGDHKPTSNSEFSN